MTVQILDHFKPGVQACWITTYNIDLGLFDGFLFNRLGEPPLNVTILADGYRHDEALATIAVDESWRVDRINRRWLLRPVHRRNAFHPKTLLFVDASTATLLVGSGNLSYRGVDAGHEVFTTFTTDNAEGRAGIAAWAQWMEALVGRADDPLLGRRFVHLKGLMPQLAPVGGGFIHNLTRPLLDQFVDVAPTPVRELHLTAPFFDTELSALQQLLTLLDPDEVVLYLAEESKIDGGQLTALASWFDGRFELRRYAQASFVHAKLVGAVGHRSGVLLSGSANLSIAGLVRSVDDEPSGNVEVGVLADLEPGVVRDAFSDPGELDASPVDLEAFATHEADYDEQGPPPPPIRLLRAIRGEGGSITLEVAASDGSSVPFDPESPQHQDLLLTDGRTASKPNEAGELTGRLVWLTDAANTVVSNRVVVTEPAELERQLRPRSSDSSSRPAELWLTDVQTPLGEILAMLHQNYIMDVSETEAVGIAERAAESNDPDTSGDSELWDRLASDTLAYDPRVTNYRSGSRPLGDDNAMLHLLAMMLARSPEDVRQRFDNILTFPVSAIDPGNYGEGGSEEGDGPAHRWSGAARVRVRARNVLRRWADAIGDDRLLWLDPAAPVINYRIMIDAISVLRAINNTGYESGLTDDDLDDLLERAVAAICSIWPTIDQTHRDEIDTHSVAATTALIALAVAPGPHRRTRLLRWQPHLTSLFRHGLAQASPTAALYLSVVFEHPTDEIALQAALQSVVDFLDDDEWIRRTEEQLELTGLQFERPQPGQDLDVVLHVGGITRPLADPRTLQLVDAIRVYRGTSAIALFGRTIDWRLAIHPGDYLTLKAPWLDDGFVDSIETVTIDRLGQLIQARSSLSELFLPEHRHQAA